MSNRMRLIVFKCPNCGGQCEPYDEDFYICESCGALVEEPVEKQVVEFRNRAKIERIRFEIRQYEDQMKEKEAEKELLKAYARMSLPKKLWFHISLGLEEFRDWFLLYPVRNLIIFLSIALAAVAIIYLTGK